MNNEEILNNKKHPYAGRHPGELTLDQINERTSETLMGSLGIEYVIVEEGRVEATMPVDKRSRQPIGILHGGAALALAETIAGMGSMVICREDETAVGMQVSGNHISSAREGDVVRGIGTLIHKGRSTHVWNIDISTKEDKLISSVRVVNYIIKKR